MFVYGKFQMHAVLQVDTTGNNSLKRYWQLPHACKDTEYIDEKKSFVFENGKFVL